ncbi:hypothetical protein D3C84_1299420 [compost metagenome]
MIGHRRKGDVAAGGNIDAWHLLHFHQIVLHHVLVQLGDARNRRVDAEQFVGGFAGVLNHEISRNGRRVRR